MTKDVIITISGLQFEAEGNEPVEVISRGEYYFRNGKHFLIYDELSEEEQEISKCVLKISEHVVELTKKGSSNVHMLFEENTSNTTYYNTPYGQLVIGISTQTIEWKAEDGQVELVIRYSLDMNYQYVSECKLTVKARSV